MQRFSFIPFKSFICERGRRLTRKRHDFLLKNHNYFPPEGHVSVSFNTETTADIFYFGGARRTEGASWSSENQLFHLTLSVEDDDVNITDLRTPSLRGASLPPLQSPGFCGKSCEQLILWGGFNTLEVCTVNDLFLFEKISSSRYKISVFKDPKEQCEFSFLKPVNELKRQLGQVPRSRTGHTLTLLSDTEFAVMHGGIQLDQRYSPAISKTFSQICDDGSFYLLNTSTFTWQLLNLPEIAPRAYHSATYLPSTKSIVFIGGVSYLGRQPHHRISVTSPLILYCDTQNDQFSLRTVSLSMCGLSPVYLSYHSTCLLGDKIVVYGGFQQLQKEIEKGHCPSPSLQMLIIDLDQTDISSVLAPANEFSTAGQTCASLGLREDCLLFSGGNKKHYFMYTSKPMIPSPCDLHDECQIMESNEISPIAWIQCDKCTKWYHQFCVQLLGRVPRGKYFCKACQSTATSNRKKQKKT
ncbi:uncharacterized protein [Ptychodera flava]|uniref:uncharacterized protein n=1 Tax=Ptychodera flava TaxID=63121 RepID=UPI00396A92F5